MTKHDAQTRNQESVGTHFSRRTVTRGMAWSVPVVAVAAQAPAFAVSRVRPRLVFEAACKFPGSSCKDAVKGYGFAFQVENLDPRSIAFCSATLNIVEPNPFPGVTFNYTGGCITVGGAGTPTDSGRLFFYFSGSGDSANTPFSASLTVKFANTCGDCSTDFETFTTSVFRVTETPPGGICQCDAAFIPS